MTQTGGPPSPGYGAPDGPPSPWSPPPQGPPPTPSGLPRYPGPTWDAPPPRSSSTNVLAILSLVFGLIGGILLGLVLGIIALGQIRRRGEQGRGLAIGGIVASCAWAVVLLATGLLALVVELSGGTDPDVAGAVPDSGRTPVEELAIGDCFQDPGGLSGGDDVLLTTLEVVPCGEAHYAEAYAQFWLEGLDYPGDAEVVDLAEAGCVERFEGFVGTPYLSSELDFLAIRPVARSWVTDRSVMCVLVEPDGSTVTGSLANADR